jgi:hypothetical protein
LILQRAASPIILASRSAHQESTKRFQREYPSPNQLRRFQHAHLEANLFERTTIATIWIIGICLPSGVGAIIICIIIPKTTPATSPAMIPAPIFERISISFFRSDLRSLSKQVESSDDYFEWVAYDSFVISSRFIVD